MTEIEAVLFDLGRVVLEWEPRRAYAQVLPPDEIGAFMEAIDFAAWNRARDSGRSYAEGEAELLARFPDRAEAVTAYREHFAHTLTGMVPGTGAVIAELQQAGVRRLALTNWSAESFPHAEERFGILTRFEGIVVSGAEGMIKPDPAIFRLACERFALDPARTVFVDDSEVNVAAAAGVGLDAVLFRDAVTLRADLVARGVLGPRVPPVGPVYHLAVRADWDAARISGAYAWSTRGVTHDNEGYVHCSLAHQVAGVRHRFYADLADADLVLLEIAADAGPFVVEDLGAGEAFPHLYAPLTPSGVLAEHDLAELADA